MFQIIIIFLPPQNKLEATVTPKEYLCWWQEEEQKGILRSVLNPRQFWVIQSGFNREHKSHIPRGGFITLKIKLLPLIAFGSLARPNTSLQKSLCFVLVLFTIRRET